ncbi:MAG: 23S rRNA (guanosine(2251)-2'-O)-methyltransferase RlmB, partial [Bacteroidetes bacterium]
MLKSGSNRGKAHFFTKPSKKKFTPPSTSPAGRPGGVNLIFGIRPVIEAIRSGKEVEKIFFQQGTGSALMAELNDEIKKYKIPFQFVPAEKLNHLMKSKNHQGVVAQLSPVTYRDIEDIIPAVFEKGEVPLVIILDRITDVRNFGAISRSAECAGAHALIIPSKGSAQINSDAIKTSAGALYQIPVCRSENLKQTCDFLKRSGLRIIACTEKTDQTIYNTDFSLPTAIILGSEEDGISEEYLKFSDEKTTIPLFGKIESLNVSVSAGITLYEVVRQRNFSK